MSVFLDTTALAALYYPEPYSDRIEAIVLAADRVLVSRLSLVELAAALSEKVRLGELSPADRAVVWEVFLSDLQSAQVHLVELVPAMMTYAAELIPKYGDDLGLKPTEALHLATAKIAGAKTFLCTVNRLVVAAGCIGLDAPMRFL